MQFDVHILDYIFLYNMSNTSLVGVRIVLDLELFFKDRRRKCYHYVDFSKNKIVGDVYEGIKSNFDLSKDISLEVNGCYVPENEDIRVLCNEDVVRVIDAGRGNCVLPNHNDKQDGQRNEPQDDEIFLNSLNDENVKRLSTLEGYENNANITISKPKKRKKSRKNSETEEKIHHEEDFDESANRKRKRKHITKLADSIPTEYEKCTDGKKYEREPNTCNNSLAVNELPTCKVEICGMCENVKTDTVVFPHVETCILDPEVGSCVSTASPKINSDGREDKLQNGGSEEEKSEHVEISTRKKRRRRKHKKTPKNADPNCFVPHLMEPSVLTKDTLKTPKHIKFEDEDEGHNYSNNIELADTCDNNALNRGVPSQLVAESESSNTNNRNSAIKDSNSNVRIADNKSDVVNNADVSSNLVFQASSTPLIFECKRTNRLPCNQSEMKETETDFSKYPLLNNVPKVNDVIAFKKFKMDSNYCPGISHYISAKVLKLSEKDRLITLRILNGHQELKEPKGKFSLEEENEADFFEERINETIEMDLPDLLDVRLMFP